MLGAGAELARGEGTNPRVAATGNRRRDRRRPYSGLMEHPSAAALPAPVDPPSARLREDLAVVLGFWAIAILALALSRSIDLQHAGRAVGFLKALAYMAPLMLPQIGFSIALAVVLHRQHRWLRHPVRLLVGALLLIPLYLVLAVPAVTVIGMLQEGRSLVELPKMLRQWTAMNFWTDGITACAGLALQIAWAYWRQAQREQQAALQARAAMAQLQLTLLQGQLEPHFLFNTLNSIAALVRGAERNVALQALNRLSELLRYSLRASQQRWVSVADELRFVDDYLALQRLRFGEALQWQADIQSDDWDRFACPPLLLQPLVENAIRYGLEAGDGGALQFAVRREAEHLCIELRNPRSESARLMAGHGLGLAKSRERLQMLYGERANIATEAQANRFHLTLHLPLEDLDATLERADR